MAPLLSGLDSPGQSMSFERALGISRNHLFGKGQVGEGGGPAETEQALERGSWAVEGRGLHDRAATETGRKEARGGVDPGRCGLSAENLRELVKMDCNNSSISCSF